jgi:hypothetical protein
MMEEVMDKDFELMQVKVMACKVKKERIKISFLN